MDEERSKPQVGTIKTSKQPKKECLDGLDFGEDSTSNVDSLKKQQNNPFLSTYSIPDASLLP